MKLTKETAHLYADKLYKEHLQLKKVKQQLSQLQRDKEELLKWLKENKMYRKKQILYMEGTELDCLTDKLLLVYDEILSKLKKSDK